MPERYLRRVRVSIGDRSERLTAENLLIDFRIRKQATGTPADGEIKIWNLNESNETRIQERGKAVTLEAGYGERIGQIFAGDVRRVERIRQGHDRITHIHVGGSIVKQTEAVVMRSYEGETPVRTIVRDAVADMGLTIGPVTLIPADAAETDYRYNGKAGVLLTGILTPLGVEWYEEAGQIRFTAQGKSADDRIRGITISENTGLIGTPTRTDDGIRVTTLLDPRMQLDAVVRIESGVLAAGASGSATSQRTAEIEGGRWKIIELAHEGNNREGRFQTTIEARPA